MNILKSIPGVCHIEITCASPTDILTAINNHGIIMYDISYVDELTFSLVIDRHQLRRLRNLMTAKGATLRITQKKGVFWKLLELKRRPIFLFGFLVFLFLSLYVPSRVFFVKIEGNESVPSRLILEKAQKCGIGFGASRRDVRSEKMKNALLESIPQLQWAGINTSGCIAIISVHERSTAELVQESKGISNIVARTDGVIKEITVTRGTSLCKAGQAVKSGQVLVSGYTDCGLFVKAESAEAEIYAQTHHNFISVTPTVCYERVSPFRKEKIFRLLVGKKLINFTKDSGISDVRCVKMYTEYYLSLPGGFQLPVTLIAEERIYYSLTKNEEKFDLNLMKLLTKNYIESQMIAGQITQEKTLLSYDSDLCVATNEYDCIEMIGQDRSEEIFNGS